MAAKHYYVDLNMNQQKILNFALESLSSDPIVGDSFSGRLFMNSTEGKLKYYTTAWSSLATEQYVADAISGLGGGYSFASGLTESEGVVSLGGYLSAPTRLGLDFNTFTFADVFDMGTAFEDVESNDIGAIRLQSDGKLLLGGIFQKYNGVTRYNFTRINRDGSEDTAFVNNLPAVSTPYSFDEQIDGKIVLSEYYNKGVNRLNPDGTVDSSFNTALGTGCNGSARVVKVLSDGKILVVGTFTAFNDVSYGNMVVLNSDGTIYSGFSSGSGFDTTVWGVDVQPDGKILLVGAFTTYNGTPVNKIVRLNTDFSLDTGFTCTVNVEYWYLTAVKVQQDGKVLVGGYSDDVISFNPVFRLNSDGSLDSGFSVTTDNCTIKTIEVGSDNSVVLGGTFTSINGASANGLVRVNSSGVVQSTFGFSPGVQVSSLDVSSGDLIYVGGTFSTYSGTDRKIFVRVTSTGEDATYVNRSVSIKKGLLEYSADYSSVFTDRSLVDKAYVDSVAGGGGTSYTFENGLTNTGGVVTLGGEITSGVTFTGTGAFNMDLVDVDDSAYLYIDSASLASYVEIGAYNATAGSYLYASPDYVELSGKGSAAFHVGEYGGINGISCNITGDGIGGALIFQDTSAGASLPFYISVAGSDINQGMRLGFQVDSHSIDIVGGTLFKGITYNSDYSSNFTLRSLVDKAYVDAVAQGLTPHADVRVATTVNLDVTASGSGGTKTLTANSNGAISVDGITLAAGERLLVKNQTTGQDNGIYVVITVGDGATPFVLSRAEDYDGSPSAEIAAGDFIYVRVGATNAATSWALLAYNGADPILETDPLNFTIIGSAGGLTAGTGINITSGEISVVGYTPVSGATVVRKKEFATQTISVGNNDFTHNLGTRAVKVAVYDESDYSEVVVTVSTTSENVVRVNSSIAFTGLVVVLG